MVRFVAQYGGSCGVAVESAGRRMAMQLESRLREALERLRLGDRTSATASGNSVGNSDNLEVMLQQLLSTAQTQASRLAKLESSCFTSPGAGIGVNTKTGFQLPENKVSGHQEQEVIARGEALDGTLTGPQQMREEMEEVLRSSKQRHLPAGKIFIIHLSCVSLCHLKNLSWFISLDTIR